MVRPISPSADHTESAPPSEPESHDAYVLRKIGEHEARLDKLEEDMGHSGDPVKKIPPAGATAAILELREAIVDLRKELTKDREDRQAAADKAKEQEKSAAARREPWSWAARVAVGAGITVTVGSGFVAFGAWLARHLH